MDLDGGACIYPSEQEVDAYNKDGGGHWASLFDACKNRTDPVHNSIKSEAMKY